MSEPGRTPAPESLFHLAQLGRGEVEAYRRALESRGVAAFVVPLRECDGPT